MDPRQDSISVHLLKNTCLFSPVGFGNLSLLEIVVVFLQGTVANGSKQIPFGVERVALLGTYTHMDPTVLKDGQLRCLCQVRFALRILKRRSVRQFAHKEARGLTTRIQHSSVGTSYMILHANRHLTDEVFPQYKYECRGIPALRRVSCGKASCE